MDKLKEKMDKIKGKKEEVLKNPRHRLYMAIGTVALFFLLVAGAFIMNQVFPQTKDTINISSIFTRIQGTVSFYILGHKPDFYYIEIEKNAKDDRLTTSDTLELTYRDEFVVKGVSTDVIFGKGIVVDVEGIGTQDDFRKPLRGIDLVDGIMKSKGMAAGFESIPAGGVHIIYKGELIASIPIKVTITPQDWLRYAQTSETKQMQIDYLKKAISMNSKDVSVRKMLAALYNLSGSMKDAIIQYQEILAIKPDDMVTYTDLFNCYMKMKAYSQAVNVGLSQIKANPKEGAAYANTALAYSYVGNWAKAIENYRMSLRIRPDDYTVHYLLADAYEKTNDRTSAIEPYKQILKKVPGDERCLIALAGALFKKGSYDESIQVNQELIKKQPHNLVAHTNIGLAYGAKGQRDKEVEYYKKAISINPRDTTIQLYLASAYEKQNQDGEAEKVLSKILETNSGDPDAILRLANIKWKNKKYDEAIKLYGKIVNTTNQKALVHANLGFAYGELKNYRLAAENYAKAIQNGNKDDQLHYNLAYTYDKLGRIREAIPEYEIYVAKHPTVDILTLLANNYVAAKEYDKAMKVYKKMIDLAPRKAAGYANLGYLYGLQNDVDKEIEYYLISFKYDKEDSQVYLNLGEAYEKKGMYKEALKAYQTAYGLNRELTRAGNKIPQMRIKILQTQ